MRIVTFPIALQRLEAKFVRKSPLRITLPTMSVSNS